jgi:hypothetical protein
MLAVLQTHDLARTLTRSIAVQSGVDATLD